MISLLFQNSMLWLYFKESIVWKLLLKSLSKQSIDDTTSSKEKKERKVDEHMQRMKNDDLKFDTTTHNALS